MTIKIGDRLPSATLYELTETGPQPRTIDELTKGKRVALFGLPGAYTPTCSAKHVPSYLDHFDALRQRGVEEILCVSVNDAYVMGAWAKDQGVDGKIRMLADGNAAFTTALGLEQDFTDRGWGIRSRRYSLLADDGVVIALNVEAPGKFEVSDAETLLTQLSKLEVPRHG